MKTQDTLKTRSSGHKGPLTLTLSSFVAAALIYLTVPVVIFFLGYLKIWWGLLFTGLTVTALVWTVKDLKKTQKSLTDPEPSITISPSYLYVIIPLILILLFIAGVSEYAWSLIDHRVRYAILNDLVNYSWPVVYDFSTQENPVVIEALSTIPYTRAAFAYYFVFWMVPAVFGKVFGLGVARAVLFAWSAGGLFLVSLGACFLYGKASKVLFAAVMLFSGFDYIPYTINNLIGTGATWEGWNQHLYIHGNYYQLFNVFNQSIPGWLITILLLLMINRRGLGLLGSLMFCYSPWAAIGFLPLCVCRLIMRDKAGTKFSVRDIFTPGNIIAPVVFFVCFAPLYTANSLATSSDGFIWEFYDTPLDLVIDYIKYAVFEFGIWFLLIIWRNKKNPLLWVSLGTLLVMPVYKITIMNDFIMRGSMAPMFIIGLYACMFVTDYFYVCLNDKKFNLKSWIVVLALILAAYVPGNMFVTSAFMTYDIRVTKEHPEEDISHDIESFGNVRKEDELGMVVTQFYVFNYEDQFFFKYLAR